MDKTDHKTVMKTNHLFSYWRHYFYLSCLQATHWLATENPLLCLRAEAGRPIPQCLPTSPGCISHLCPGSMYLLTTAFTPGDSFSINTHRDLAAARGLSRTIILPAQRGICGIPTLLLTLVLLFPPLPPSANPS